MLTIINDLFLQFKEFTKINPVISGVVGLWGLTVISFFFKEVPGYLWSVFVKQFTVTVVINCKDEAFYHFIMWYQKEGHSEKARTLRLNNGRYGNSRSKAVLSAGYGNHYFFMNGMPFKLSRTKEKAGNFNEVKESLSLTTIGRNQKPILKILEEITPRICPSKETKIYKWIEGYWKYSYAQEIRGLETIILESNVEKKLVKHMDNFENDMSWYKKHSIPYRTGICLYGPPGTGKTSLVKAICGKYRRNLYILNLNTITDAGIEAAFDGLGPNAVVLIEDIDSFKATNNRATEDKDDEKSNNQLTLSGILNAVDGIAGSSGRILIMTTNSKESLDSALVRPGRVDLELELSYLNNEMFVRAMKRFYPSSSFDFVNIGEKVSPAKLQNLIISNKEKPEDVVDTVARSESRKVMSIPYPKTYQRRLALWERFKLGLTLS